MEERTNTSPPHLRRRPPPSPSLRLEYFNSNSFLPVGHSNLGAVASADGITEGEVVMEERTNTSPPPSLASPPPFLPKRTPNMTARATIGAVTRAMRVPRRLSLEVPVVASSILIVLLSAVPVPRLFDCMGWGWGCC